MDVSKYDFDGEWVEIVVESEKVTEPFRFKVQPVGELAAMSVSDRQDKITAMFIQAVVGWELTDGDKPLPCDEKAKQLYLPRFAMYLVKTVNGRSPNEEQEEVVAKAIAKADAETDQAAKFRAELVVATERARLQRPNMAGAVVSFAGKPDNFLKK